MAPTDRCCYGTCNCLCNFIISGRIKSDKGVIFPKPLEEIGFEIQTVTVIDKVTLKCLLDHDNEKYLSGIQLSRNTKQDLNNLIQSKQNPNTSEEKLKMEIQRLKDENQSLRTELGNMERVYNNLVEENFLERKRITQVEIDHQNLKTQLVAERANLATAEAKTAELLSELADLSRAYANQKQDYEAVLVELYGLKGTMTQAPPASITDSTFTCLVEQLNIAALVEYKEISEKLAQKSTEVVEKTQEIQVLKEQHEKELAVKDRTIADLKEIETSCSALVKTKSEALETAEEKLAKYQKTVQQLTESLQTLRSMDPESEQIKILTEQNKTLTSKNDELIKFYKVLIDELDKYRDMFRSYPYYKIDKKYIYRLYVL